MDGGTAPGAEVLSPGEAEWPPELRLPPVPPSGTPSLWPRAFPAPHLKLQAPAAPPPPKEPSPPRHAEGGFDDQQFLGSMMGAAAPHQHQQHQTAASHQHHHHHHQQQPPAPPAPVKRKRGRPPKNRDATQAAVPAPVNKKDEEVVCFICFDGGDLVVCDRRGCPKVYHPACIKRDESFFRCRGKWDCGWHICSSCEKAVQYMCYTCTYSLCKGCIKQGKFFGVRGNKGFCDTCYGTILLIESKDGGAEVGVDFDDKNSWEYLFKLYWLDLKGKHLLTMGELFSAKSRWTIPTTASRREKEDSSDELYDAHDDQDASFDISSRKRRRNNLSGKRGQKRKKDSGVIKKAQALNADSQKAIDSDSGEVGTGGYNEWTSKLGSDKRRKAQKKIQIEQTTNLEDYAAIDMHNINLIYLRRSLMEDLIDDDASFSDKIAGAFVRIRISGLGNKQDMYRLVKVLGTHKVADRYNVGKKTTDYALEISNLDKKEVITMDTISNQDFTEEECKRLRQSMKFGLTARLKVGDIYEKAKIFQSLRFTDWLENEKQRLNHLRDRASETGRRKELRECVEKLQLLDTAEEKTRRINEVPEVHVDPRMTPNYESAEEQDYKKAVDWTMKRNGTNLGRKGMESNSVQNTEKCLEARGYTSTVPTEDVVHPTEAGSNINLNNTAVEPILPGVASNDTEPEKVWHYKDPKGAVHGPFTLLQLSKWVSFFPRDLRIWLTFESEENSLLLSEVLSKQQSDFVQPPAATASDKSIWAGTGKDRINSIADISSSPMGYNVVYSSALSRQFAEVSDPTKEDPKHWGTALPSRSLKDAHSLHGQVQHQVNYSSTTILSSVGSYAQTGSHDERVPRGQVGEWNSYQDNAGTRSPTIAPINHSCKSNMEQFTDGCTRKDQLQTDSKSNFHSVPVLTPQQSERDPAAPLSTTGLPESCSPTNPFEDRDSSSASAVSSQSGAPAYLPQPVPSASTSNSSKAEATINEHKACRRAASNTQFDKDPEPRNGPIFSLKTQDVECEYLGPTPKLERKETSMNQSGSPEDLASKIGTLQSLKEKSCLEGKHLIDGDSITQMDHLLEDNTVNGNNKSVNPVSDAEGIAVSDVFESLTEQNCERYSIPEATPLENVVAPSAEEEQPQCSSPIALSPWGEPSYYQGEAVDSALWDVQDDPGNDMWSMPSPTPALQPSSGLGADGKNTSCIIGEVTAVRGNSAFAEKLTQGEKKMEQRNSSASTGPGVAEQVKPKPSAASGPSLEGSTKPSGWQPSGSSLEGSAKASGWKPPALSLEVVTNDSGPQPSCPPTLGSAKAPGWQRSSSSPDGSRKTSGRQPPVSSTEGSARAAGWHRSSKSPEGSARSAGWHRSGTSPEGSRKASGWQRSGSFTQRSTKASGLQASGSTEGSAKVDGRQRRSSSPEGTRKSSGLHWSGRESLKVSSTSGNDNRKLSRHSSEAPKKQGTSNKSTSVWEEALGNSWEASKRQGNSDKTAGWGEALGCNRSWHPSSGNATRGSQGNHHHDRHSHGSESWRGSSHHTRRSDNRYDHGSDGSSRSSSRGQPQRGVCKFYENGHCWKGSKCQYQHR